MVCNSMHVYEMARTTKFIKRKSRLVAAQGRAGWEVGSGDNNWGIQGFFLGQWNYSKIISWWWLRNSVSTFENHWVACFKRVNRVICKFYPNKTVMIKRKRGWGWEEKGAGGTEARWEAWFRSVCLTPREEDSTRFLGVLHLCFWLSEVEGMGYPPGAPKEEY